MITKNIKLKRNQSRVEIPNEFLFTIGKDGNDFSSTKFEPLWDTNNPIEISVSNAKGKTVDDSNISLTVTEKYLEFIPSLKKGWIVTFIGGK